MTDSTFEFEEVKYGIHFCNGGYESVKCNGHSMNMGMFCIHQVSGVSDDQEAVGNPRDMGTVEGGDQLLESRVEMFVPITNIRKIEELDWELKEMTKAEIDEYADRSRT